MERKQFSAILPLLVGSLVNSIIEETGIDEDESLDRLYNSELYAMLENEETKLWTYSVSKLFDLYQMEMITGKLELPEY